MLHPFADSSIILCMQALPTPIRFATGHAYRNIALVCSQQTFSRIQTVSVKKTQPTMLVNACFWSEHSTNNVCDGYSCGKIQSHSMSRGREDIFFVN